MYSAFLQDDPPVVSTPETAGQQTVATVAEATPARQPRWPGQRRFSPRRHQYPMSQAMQPVNQQQPQFYDHQMAMAAQQNLRNQQQQAAPAAEPSGIGGISWPVIALAGGGFLLVMMMMMSGKK